LLSRINTGVAARFFSIKPTKNGINFFEEIGQSFIEVKLWGISKK